MLTKIQDVEVLKMSQCQYFLAANFLIRIQEYYKAHFEEACGSVKIRLTRPLCSIFPRW